MKPFLYALYIINKLNDKIKQYLFMLYNLYNLCTTNNSTINNNLVELD